MWECPDFFPLGDKHVLFYSTQGKVLWHTGTFDKKELIFHPEQSGILDHGSFYAPKTQLDKAGNRILWGWIPETRPVAEYSASGWAGLMSLPRILTLGPDNRLRFTVDPAAEKLRQREQKLTLTPIKPGAKELLSSATLKGACGELLCAIKPGQEPFTVDLLSPVNPQDKEATSTQASFLSIRYSHANPKELIVDTQRLPITLAAGEPIEMHFYIDGSVIELIVNNQSAITKRFDYPNPSAPEIAVNFTGKSEDVTRLSMWQFTPISKNRLTT
jgi:beta-fructofuranosidase